MEKKKKYLMVSEDQKYPRVNARFERDIIEIIDELVVKHNIKFRSRSEFVRFGAIALIEKLNAEGINE